ncbi:hypothetical protein GCM10023191_056460 [Actinoallomurus oryzae]|uniref:Uncharacterized protein n=1 Tax=Actinoallomurus oryzae TaxID=502180 RepID=A0ABP8QHI1_9ACTN
MSWPRARSASSTECQYQPTSPAPWIKTNVATVSPPAAAIPDQSPATLWMRLTVGDGTDIPAVRRPERRVTPVVAEPDRCA